ncbi:MAG: mechanosensitive ion channel domain-containing protein [Verrucomicrobiota bacterium]
MLAQATNDTAATAASLQDKIEAWGIKIVVAIGILIIGYAVALAIVGLLKRYLSKTKIDKTILSFVDSASRGILFALLLVAALTYAGVPSASMVAVLGAAGLAIALSLQSSLSNLASGVLLSIFRPFGIGDAVEINGQVGIVEDMQILFTKMHTPDNRDLILPNSVVLGGMIINITANDTRRMDLIFGIGYEDDIDHAKRVLQEIVDADQRILKEPAPVIGVAELGESSVNFWVRPWVNRTDYLNVMFDLNETVKKRFDAEGISIPYPQRDVHLHGAISSSAAV